jgi:transposase
MHVTERYPHESWRDPSPVWRTRRARYGGPLDLIVRYVKDGGPPNKWGRFTSRFSHVAADRAVFYRFTTKPDWSGIKAAQAGAATLLKRSW